MFKQLKQKLSFRILICAFTIFLTIALYSFVQNAILDFPLFMNMGYYESDTYVCLVLSLIFLAIYCAFFYSKDKSLSNKDYIYIIFMSLGLGGITMIYFNILDLFSTTIPYLGESIQSFDDIWKTGNDPFIWILLSTVILGPLVEELMFRGIIFKAAERLTNKFWFPILVSGLSFGIWHWQPVQIGYTAIDGIIYGYIYSKKRSLKFTLALHIINNLLSSFQDITNNSLMLNISDKLPYYFLIPALFCLYLIATEKDTNKI